MVVQRSWKIQSDSPSTSNASAGIMKSLSVGGNSSSEDSNGSNQTTHSIATSLTSSSSKVQDSQGTAAQNNSNNNNNESFKFVTTPQMAENMLQRLKERLGPPIATHDSVMNSLELLRSHLQSIFDKEIEPIVESFMDTYFKPAVKNIKENMGEHSITDGMLKTIVCTLLEESKKKYIGIPSNSDLSQTALKNCESQISSRLCAKRPVSKIFPGTDLNKKTMSSSIHGFNTSSTASTRTPLEPTEPLIRKLTVVQPRRQIFWNTAELSANTNFILDVQANQAFGFGTDGKERLASKHPELIRYLPDGQDRDWLVGQNIISPQNRNSRFLFLIHDEVLKLYQTNNIYKIKSNINLSIMHTFKVPEFIIEKMKVFFVDLNIKSRGLITNSFCSTNFTQASTSISSISSSTSSSSSSSSHLRNALLQGASIPLPNMVDACCNVSGNGNNAVNGVSTSAEVAINSNQSKARPSTLSSSHATLTALLNNPNSSLGGTIIKTNGMGARNSMSFSRVNSEK